MKLGERIGWCFAYLLLAVLAILCGWNSVRFSLDTVSAVLIGIIFGGIALGCIVYAFAQLRSGS